MIIPTYNSTLYLRLSRDDELQGDSSSIVTQRQMLRKYASEHNINVYDEYVDDGWSGTNFDRPEFQRMISDIEDGKINCVIVKDLSRLGRNYILTGQYTELYFPSHNVRFIAVNDNVDSINGDNEFAPFKNIINEWYARDVSRKDHAAFQTKFAMGERFFSYAPIGYKRDPEHHNRLVIDEETRPMIEKIFGYALNGMGAGKITRLLIQEKVPTPAWINFKRYGTFAHIFKDNIEEKRYMWTISQVKSILKDETYIGNTVHNKQTTVSFKSKKKYRKPKSEWFRVENTHEAIISKDDFLAVQEMIKSRRRQQANGTTQIFAGLVKCADCGYSLKFGSRQNKSGACWYFVCNKYSQLGKDFCSTHFIRYEVLYEFVLSRIKYWANVAHSDETALLEKLIKNGSKDLAESKNRAKSDISKAEKRLREVDALFTKLYEDRVSGSINERNYIMLSAKYQQEQDELQAKIDSLKAKLKEETEDVINKERWIALIKQYTDPQELTAPMLNSLIEKIAVHDAVKTEDGMKEQEVEIFYRFIGKLD